MQNQINTNPESPDTVTFHAATPQFIIGPGGVVNLTGGVFSAAGLTYGRYSQPLRIANYLLTLLNWE